MMLRLGKKNYPSSGVRVREWPRWSAGLGPGSTLGGARGCVYGQCGCTGAWQCGCEDTLVHGRATVSVRSNARQWWRCPADAGSSAMAVRSCDRTCNARANRTSRVRGPSDPPRSLTVSALSVQGASCSAAGRVVCRTMPPVNPHEDVWKHCQVAVQECGQ